MSCILWKSIFCNKTDLAYTRKTLCTVPQPGGNRAITPWNFQKHVQTTSYNHFAPTRKYQLVAALLVHLQYWKKFNAMKIIWARTRWFFL